MSDNNSSASSGGIGLTSALGILFIGLKLGHVIDWPWIWVLAPFWVGLALVLTIFAFIFIGAIIAAIFKGL